jgi:hypothetical protein
MAAIGVERWDVAKVSAWAGGTVAIATPFP